MVRHLATFIPKEHFMSRSSNALPRCAALLMACAALAGQAAQAGMIMLENQLPVAASCAVHALFGDPFEDPRVNPVYEDELFDVRLRPATSCLQDLPIGQWPVQLRLDSFANAYSVSPLFIKLSVKCHVGAVDAEGHERVATFVNPDYWESEGDVGDEEPRRDQSGDHPWGELSRSGGSTFRIDPPRRGIYKLSTYTPTDYTLFRLRLQPADAGATAAQLLAGAPLTLELSAMPLLFDGSPLHAAPLQLGSFGMVPAPDDDGEPSSSGWAPHDPLSDHGADDSHQGV
ncbi:hypothetical protein GALL_305200 [mine drainage metagenome]|uniref:Uncharacterized protein n=1 Tax=mine drainage metagenome TaxID=410659 RepID=A0A1J5QVC6_9ZZZZ